MHGSSSVLTGSRKRNGHRHACNHLKETILLSKPILLSLLTLLGVVLLGCLLDSGFLYYQATRGKLPFKLRLLPVFGGDTV